LFIASAELQLAIACCRAPNRVTTSIALADALAKSIDWSRFYAILRRHRIVSLANFNLSRSGQHIPAEARAMLSAAARKLATQDLLHAAETVRLQHSFDQAGLPALFLKGATTGMLAYGRLGVKQSWDIDLLTTESSLMDSFALLQRDGYQLVHPKDLSRGALARFGRFYHEAELRNAQGLSLELHWRLFSKPILQDVTALSESQVVPLGGGSARTLTDDLLISYLVAHGQEHGWSRLKWLADLNALLERRDGAQLAWLIERADALEVGSKLCAALLLCEQLLGLDLPPDVAARCRQDRSAKRLVAVSLDCIEHPVGGSKIPPLSRVNLALIASRLGRHESKHAFLGELATLWTQPGTRAKYPPALDWLYHVLRIPLLLLRFPLKLAGLRRGAAAEGVDQRS
jgi:hypothetical protein